MPRQGENTARFLLSQVGKERKDRQRHNWHKYGRRGKQSEYQGEHAEEELRNGGKYPRYEGHFSISFQGSPYKIPGSFDKN